ncbi:MAG: VIT and VWA domain-containing protein [Candidatus Thiodiazotropha sp. (ex Monitilora ramsayi)]|nr:VIT and VWA domain-containing protein [Candidatus Thiodiazotropha sp. (ex Monitilora ramsayi)]
MTTRHLLRKAWQGILLTSAFLTVTLTQAAGLLQPSDGSLPALEITDHQVNVVIEDGYAVTTVDQVFHNPHSQDLEAHYSFPVPEHGSVAEFTLWIDGKPVTGEVLERQQAKQVYEEEKAAGRDAGITEKESYKTFDARVSPVRAGQETRIRLVYLQPAQVDTGIGRYVYPLEEGGVDEEKLAFWTANEKVKRQFSFDLQVRSAYPVHAVRMPNQPQASIQQVGEGDWRIHLGNDVASSVETGMEITEEERSRLNTQSSAGSTPVFTLDKDLVVYWRHQTGLPGSVDLVAHKPEGKDRGTFMLVVTPGDDLRPIKEGKDWVFVLDISGSMQGKYATLADGVQRALKKLSPEDRFRIVLFNSGTRELTSGFVNATQASVTKYSQAVAAIAPNQGTNLYEGLKLGLKSLDADRTSALVLVTDGVANVGVTQQRQFIDLIKKRDVRLFTFVMGNSANRPLLEAMTRASNGFAVSISNSDDIVGQLLTATAKVTHEALHGAKLKINGIKTADLTPKQIGSLYRGQQLVVFGHYWGDGLADVTLTGRVSGEHKAYQTRFAFPAVATENPEIERLWAYAAIEAATAEMNDFGENLDLKQAIIDLGVEYSLVTDYTAMVVVRDEVFEQRGIERSNQKRLQVEHAAQQQRASQAAPSRRVDTHKPMYRTSRPSHSGGGALDAWTLLLILPLVWFTWRQRKMGEAS